QHIQYGKLFMQRDIAGLPGGFGTDMLRAKKMPDHQIGTDI
ncbi:MAG: hypothetical protein ACI9U6_001409, partial [Loktanella salsilacus]